MKRLIQRDLRNDEAPRRTYEPSSGSPVRTFQLDNIRANVSQQLSYRKKIYTYKDFDRVYLENTTDAVSLFNLVTDPVLYGGVTLDESTTDLTKIVFPIRALKPGDVFVVTLWGVVSAAGRDGTGSGSDGTFTMTFYGLEETSVLGPAVSVTIPDILAGDFLSLRITIYGRVTTDSAGDWGVYMAFEITLTDAAPAVFLYKLTGINLAEDELAFMTTVNWSVADPDNVFWFDNFHIEVM